MYINESNKICYKFNDFKNKEIKLSLNNAKIKRETIRICLQ